MSTVSPTRALIAASALFIAACGGERSSTDATGPSGRLSITSIAPDTLRGGGQVTVSGTGFSSFLLADALLVDGVAANVVSATDSQMRAILPATLPCAPPHLATVTVRAAGTTATARHPAHPGLPRSLAVGQVLLLGAGQAGCNDLPGAGARYQINVFSAIPSPIQSADFVATGSSSGVSSDASSSLGLAPPGPSRLDSGDGAAAHHLDRLRHDAAFLRAHAGAFASRASVGSRQARAPSTPAVGSFRTLALPIPSCANPTMISARVAAVSRRAIVYEDTAQGWGDRMDSTFAEMAQIFDAEIYPSDSANFADPLLMDSLTDDDGRVGLVFSERVNLAGDQGLFSPCDLLPATPTQASNFGEYIYVGLLPSTFPNGAAVWLQETPMVVAHETKHLASFAWRALHDAPPEAGWVEEGLAVTAEEVWARDHVYHVPWKGNTGYDKSMFCDLHLTESPCRGLKGMTDEVFLLYHFLDSAGAHSPFGQTAPGDFSFYNSGWSLMRWAVDRYAADESAMLRAMTQSQSLTGIANIASVVGQSPDEVVGRWSLALILDDDPATASNPDLNIASWKIYDILAGIRRDAPGIPALAFFFANLPQAPVLQTETDNFSVAHAGLFGGGFFPIRVTTGSAPTFSFGLMGARGAAGVSAAPSELRIGVARLQ